MRMLECAKQTKKILLPGAISFCCLQIVADSAVQARAKQAGLLLITKSKKWSAGCGSGKTNPFSAVQHPRDGRDAARLYLPVDFTRGRPRSARPPRPVIADSCRSLLIPRLRRSTSGALRSPRPARRQAAASDLPLQGPSMGVIGGAVGAQILSTCEPAHVRTNAVRPEILDVAITYRTLWIGMGLAILSHPRTGE